MSRKDGFFEKLERQGLAVTFADVRLRTGYSKVPPHEVDLATLFSRNVGLKIPIVASPMDTVTEHAMAIALAMCGGLGIIHRGMDVERQVAEVARVKSYLHACIVKPVCFFEDQTVGEVSRIRAENKYKFWSFPVLNRENQLVGLLTSSDFELCDDDNQLVSKAMTAKLITAPVGTDLNKAYELMKAEKKKRLPLVDDQNHLAGMYVFSDVKPIKTGSRDRYNLDGEGHLRVGAAIGTGSEEIERALMLAEQNVDVIIIDASHGGTEAMEKTLTELRRKLGEGIDLVAGNISEGELAQRLIEVGADGLRVGQGGGSICTTRIVAGYGCPQVTAVYNCAKIAKKRGVPVCADGGIEYSGDIPIAIGAGAHSVMLGKLLAGTDEAPGETITINGVPHKEYRGMGSLGAMKDSAAARQRYQQKGTQKDMLVPEGVEAAVPYAGSVMAQLHQYVEGLRRGMGAVGAATIEELREKADFHLISTGGQHESHPHGVTILREPPNYRKELS